MGDSFDAKSGTDTSSASAGDWWRKHIARIPLLEATIFLLIGILFWYAADAFLESSKAANRHLGALAVLIKVIGKAGEIVAISFGVKYLLTYFSREKESQHELMLADLRRVVADERKLFEREATAANMVGFIKPADLPAKRQAMITPAGELYVIGTATDALVDLLSKRPSGDVPARLYSCVPTISDQRLEEILDVPEARLELYHVERTGLINLIVASDPGGVKRGLIEFLASDGRAAYGYELHGQAAATLFDSVVLRLKTAASDDGGLPPTGAGGDGPDVRPVRIFSMLDTAALRKHYADYAEHLAYLRRNAGEPLLDNAGVCDRMMWLLERAGKSLDVTHVVTDREQVEVLKTDLFKKWIGANYAAAAGTGRNKKVAVRRIFLIAAALKDDPDLNAAMKEMTSRGIEVYVLRCEDLADRYRRDFSVYDGKDAVFIPYENDLWAQNRTEARHTDYPARVKEYRDLFAYLLDKKPKRVTA